MLKTDTFSDAPTQAPTPATPTQAKPETSGADVTAEAVGAVEAIEAPQRKRGRPPGTFKRPLMVPVEKPPRPKRAPRSDKGQKRPPRVSNEVRAVLEECGIEYAALRIQALQRWPSMPGTPSSLSTHQTFLLTPPPQPGQGHKGHLPNEIKRLLVELNAHNHAPSKIVKWIKELTGFEISIQQVEYYDPSKRASAGLAPRWCELFDETMQAHAQERNNVHLFCKTFTLDRLGQLFEEETEKPTRNIPLLMKLLELGAKVEGDYWAKPQRRGAKRKDGTS